MQVFRSIVLSAALSGLIVGGVVTVVQQFGTVPLILQAEAFEKAGEESGALTHHEAGAVAHPHDAEAWEPRDVVQRNGLTAAFNVIDWIGFGLILTAIFVMVRRPSGAREGLFWGLAGFVAVVLAPSLGLPPELPGMAAAELAPRQVWWVGTAIATAVGLGLIVFVRSPWVMIAAVALIALPHLVGAPRPENAATNVPDILSQRFTVAVMLTALLSWALLGMLTAFFYRRFAGLQASAGRA